MSLFLANKIKGGNNAEFENKVIAIANQLGIKPNWLMIVMNFEKQLTKSRKVLNLSRELNINILNLYNQDMENRESHCDKCEKNEFYKCDCLFCDSTLTILKEASK